MRLKKKRVALCVDLLSHPEKKNSVEPVLPAMCYCTIFFISTWSCHSYKKRRQNQDLLEGGWQQANAQSWHKSTIILLQINIKALSGDFFGEIEIINFSLLSPDDCRSICQVTWIGFACCRTLVEFYFC